jgi:hypothetical protein
MSQYHTQSLACFALCVSKISRNSVSWHVLVDNVVRPGDSVHSLLRMAAKQVAQCISRGDPTSSEWRCLPDELAEVVDTFLRKEREKRQTYATRTRVPCARRLMRVSYIDGVHVQRRRRFGHYAQRASGL